MPTSDDADPGQEDDAWRDTMVAMVSETAAQYDDGKTFDVKAWAAAAEDFAAEQNINDTTDGPG